MNAKSKADFINSVGSVANVPCPKCGSNNKADSIFCIYCGSKMSIDQETQNKAVECEAVEETQDKAAECELVEETQNNPVESEVVKETQSNAVAFEPVEEIQNNDTAFEAIEEIPDNAVAFEPVEETKDNAVAFETDKEVQTKTFKYVEPSNAFAEGLPDWSIEPPNVMVRRH